MAQSPQPLSTSSEALNLFTLRWISWLRLLRAGAEGLAFHRAVDATQEDTLRVSVLQDFDDDRLVGTFREHLALDREYKLVTAESWQLKFILTRHRQEGDTRSFRVDPLHPRKITYHHGGGPVVRVRLER